MNKYPVILFIISVFATSCANIVAPTGGPRDKEAPKILNNPIDSNLNFKGGKIAIEFDEYIKLQDMQKQLQVTPLLKNNPKINVKKKNLIIELPDSILSDNTTYNINFGNSIKDLRESNTYENLNIVFSTGGYFDSLRLNGYIFDAQSGSKDTGLSAYLYDIDIADSNLLREKPMYVSKVENGFFKFNSLPNRSFKLVALKDKNSNYTYDALGEKVAFYEKSVSPLKDTNVILYSFLEAGKIDTNKKEKSLRGGNNKKEISDTLQYSIMPRLAPKNILDINDTLYIQFTDSLKKIDLNNIRLYEKDVWDLSTTINFNEGKNRIEILANWKLDTDYELILLNGFVQDSTRRAKGDTIIFKTKAPKDYGNIIAKIESKLLKENNIISLYQGKNLISQKTLKDTTAIFKQLTPGKYSLQILYDENKNGQWDNGNFKERIQPEITIKLPKAIVVKANWDKEIIWEERSKKKGRTPKVETETTED